MVKWGYNQKIREDLSAVEINQFANMIANLDFRSEQYIDYGTLLLRFLMKSSNQKGLMINMQTHTLITGQKLYRTRAMGLDDIKKIDGIHHFLSPPKEYVKYGRLNKPNQPMLYTAIDKMELAIVENPQIKDYFIMVEFIVTKPIPCSYIGSLFQDSERFEFKMPKTKEFHIINNFPRDLLMFKSPNQNYYVFTNGIIDKIYYPNKTSKNGYIYHSAVQNSLLNACLHPNLEHKSLKINKVIVMKKIGNNKYHALKKLDITRFKD